MLEKKEAAHVDRLQKCRSTSKHPVRSTLIVLYKSAALRSARDPPTPVKGQGCAQPGQFSEPLLPRGVGSQRDERVPSSSRVTPALRLAGGSYLSLLPRGPDSIHCRGHRCLQKRKRRPRGTASRWAKKSPAEAGPFASFLCATALTRRLFRLAGRRASALRHHAPRSTLHGAPPMGCR